MPKSPRAITLVLPYFSAYLAPAEAAWFADHLVSIIGTLNGLFLTFREFILPKRAMGYAFEGLPKCIHGIDPGFAIRFRGCGGCTVVSGFYETLLDYAMSHLALVWSDGRGRERTAL